MPRRGAAAATIGAATRVAVTRFAVAGFSFASLAVAAPVGTLDAQSREPFPVAAASTRATVELALNGRVIGGRWFPGAVTVEGPGVIRIRYGQPHRRGRDIVGGLVPMDSVWRFGANLATEFHTDVDLLLGGTRLPRGTYTLYALPSRDGWTLIVNGQTAQWGSDYDASRDVARIPLRVRTAGPASEPLESFTAWIVPTIQAMGKPPEPAHGVIRFAWERTTLELDFRVAP